MNDPFHFSPQHSESTNLNSSLVFLSLFSCEPLPPTYIPYPLVPHKLFSSFQNSYPKFPKISKNSPSPSPPSLKRPSHLDLILSLFRSDVQRVWLSAPAPAENQQRNDDDDDDGG